MVVKRTANRTQYIPRALFDSLASWSTQYRQGTHNVPYADDYQHAKAFIYSYRSSLPTFNAYRREIERFLQWTWYIAKNRLKILSATI